MLKNLPITKQIEKKSTYHCRVSHLKNVIRDLAFVPPRINSFQVCVFMVGD